MGFKVLAAGPTLILEGAVDVRPKEEGFTDPHVLGAGVRTTVGIMFGKSVGSRNDQWLMTNDQ